MQRMKNIKIWIGILYLILLSIFLYFLFSKFSIEEITTYNFIRSNSKYLVNLREENMALVSFVFMLIGILWVLLQGFGSPLVLASGFLFGAYIGTVICVISISFGATLIYIFANFFFKDLIREKFLNKNLTDRKYFVFADTVTTVNYERTNQGHGWLGVRFQKSPECDPNDIVIHVNLYDQDSHLQQETIGVLGTNMIHSCFFMNTKKSLVIVYQVLPPSVE